MTSIEKAQKYIVEFILQGRNRQRIADAAGVHLNTVSDLVNGKRDDVRIKTLIKLETAINEIKRKREDNWMYRG